VLVPVALLLLTKFATRSLTVVVPPPPLEDEDLLHPLIKNMMDKKAVADKA
jgi:hypothetical protein